MQKQSWCILLDLWWNHKSFQQIEDLWFSWQLVSCLLWNETWWSGQILSSHIACKPCAEYLRQWKNGRQNSLKFGVPMIWCEPQNHNDDCYFHAFDLVGLNKRTKLFTKFSYPSLKSARRPVAHSDDIPVPVPKESVLSDTKPFEHHEETSDSSDMDQADNFLLFLISHNCLIKRSWMAWLEIWICQKNNQRF